MNNEKTTSGEEILKPAYYAVIPAEVKYDRRLTFGSKLLYGEITALCNKEGFCWAGNKYFSDLFDVNTDTIKEWVSQLNKNGYVRVEIINNNKRKIFIYSLQKTEIGRPKKAWGGAKKGLDNNINNISLTLDKSKDKRETPNSIMKSFLSRFEKSKDEAYKRLEKYLNQTLSEYDRSNVDKFVNYWTELNKTGTKQRWELEKTFELKRRLKTWFERSKTFNFKENNNITKSKSNKYDGINVTVL